MDGWMFPWSLQLQGSLSLYLSEFISVLFKSIWLREHSRAPALSSFACRTCSGTTAGQCWQPLISVPQVITQPRSITQPVPAAKQSLCVMGPGGSSGPGAGAAPAIGMNPGAWCLHWTVQGLTLPLIAAQLSRTRACGAPAACIVLRCGHFWVEA